MTYGINNCEGYTSVKSHCGKYCRRKKIRRACNINIQILLVERLAKGPESETRTNPVHGEMTSTSKGCIHFLKNKKQNNKHELNSDLHVRRDIG